MAKHSRRVGHSAGLDWPRRRGHPRLAAHGTSQTWQLAERQRSQIADSLFGAGGGEQKFRTRPPSATSFSLGDAVARYVLVCCSQRFSRRTSGIGALVKEKPSVLPGLLFGLGFGGFVDGIVLHEILQWHHMISGAQSSETLAGLELNVVADGVFHVVTWLLVMAGSIMTLVSWRQGRLAPTWSFHFGLLVAGWGFFNVVEGLIDHQLLGVHHVRDDLGAPLSWDIGFLVFGVVLIGAGWVLYRRGSRKLAASAR